MQQQQSQQQQIPLQALFLKSDSRPDQRRDLIISQLQSQGFTVHLASKTQQAIQTYNNIFPNIDLVVAALGIENDNSDYFEPLIKHIRNNDQKTFICMFSTSACWRPKQRMDLFNKYQCNMVTECLQSLKQISEQIKEIKLHNFSNQNQNNSNLTCPICKSSNFSEDGLWIHLPLYHVNSENTYHTCPICKKQDHIGVHFRNFHGPCGRGELHNDFHNATSLYAFSLVVVKRKTDGKYLLVQEFANVGYWLPGGRVDPGESLKKAAIRETKEEAGIDIDVKGILTMQFNHKQSSARMRIIYYAEPVDENQLPKSIPDYESVGAIYVDASQIRDLHLRGNEPLEWINYLENQGQIYPLEVFSRE